MKCKICKNDSKDYKLLISHIKQKHNLSSKEYYDKYLKKEIEGICLKCNNQTKFNSVSKGYRKFCSSKCSNSSILTLNKTKETNIKKYNVEHVSQRNDIKEQKKTKSIIKYGVECPFQNDEIKEKSRKTNRQTFGVDYPTQNIEIRRKIERTNLKRYGVNNPFELTEIKDYIKKIKYEKFLLKIKKLLNYLDLELCSDYKGEFDNINIKCKKCNNIFINKWNNIQQGSSCPYCTIVGKSKYEIDLINFVNSLNLKIIENDRIIIKPLELDIYISSKNIAIEFDGLYWHSENFNKNKNYHLNKTEECGKNNIKLIHIFEDEWVFKQDIVKSRLKQILGINKSKRIHARKCQIREISPKTKNEFLNNFHIQGGDRSNIKLGAFYNNELVSVMTFSHGSISKGSKNINGVWELSRFCSNSKYHIPGIASKLLTYFKRNYEWLEIFSYADRRWSKGNVYYKLGFKLEHITKPNYWYIKNQERIHRFNLRKRSDEPKDIPEWILRSKEGYHRIWDCGHLKFILKCRG